MNLVSVRIITTDVERLASFYEEVTGVAAVRYTVDFAELLTSFGTLAIGSVRTLSLFGESPVAQPAQNHSAILEFVVRDVDAESERLTGFLKQQVVQPPTTMPWGNRSFLFRDPDGNLVNFFTPASAEARKKFEAKLAG